MSDLPPLLRDKAIRVVVVSQKRLLITIEAWLNRNRARFTRPLAHIVHLMLDARRCHAPRLLLKGVPEPIAVAATIIIRLTTIWFAVALGLSVMAWGRAVTMQRISLKDSLDS